MSPDEERILIENGFSAERGFSAEFLQMSPEQQNQVASEIMDDLEQNYVVVIEDGHAVLKERSA